MSRLDTWLMNGTGLSDSHFNESDEPFVFLCVKGNPKLYISGRNNSSDNLDKNFC